ncbi:MAG TPA: hypothetical protein DEA90_16150 [Opitutae bacterium]|nr:hypothetical protein [Opitutae bacterium]
MATCFICNISFAQSYSTSFTSGEGFSDGSLSGNANWSEYGAGDSLFTVQDATGEGNVQVGSGFAGVANSSTVYDWTVTTGKFTQSTEFQFTDIAGSVSATTLYRQYFSKDSDGTGAEDRTYLEIRKNGTTFQLAAFGTSVYSFSESDLGLSGSDPDSDVIRITSQFEAGATSSDWIGTYTIYNVTTDATLVSDSITLSSLGFTLIGDSSVHGAMNVDNETGAVSSLEVLSFSTSYVIPEPSAFAMLTGVFALACVAVRRRRG